MALTDSTTTFEPLRQEGKVVSYLVNGGENTGLITQGCLAVVDSGGYLTTYQPASAISNSFVGVTLEGYDNQTGNDGGGSVLVAKSGTFEFNYSADGNAYTTPTQDLVGKTAYILTNDCVTTSDSVPTNPIACGVVVGINAISKKIRIRIDNFTK